MALYLTFILATASEALPEPWRAKYDSTETACMPPINEDSLSLFTVPDPGIRALYSRDARYQGYLDVEGALALSEMDAGIVPKESALLIARNAEMSFINRSAIIQYGIKENHPLMPLIETFTDALNTAYNTTKPGGWVHWGATTQNVVQTGFTLAVRRALAIIFRLLGSLTDALAALATKTADVVLAGRTHGQQAVPITFGFKVATWLDELDRHASRLLAAQPRLLVALVGGAVGSMASFSKPGAGSINHGIAIHDGVAARLGLGTLGVPARTTQDHFVEFVLDLAMLGATCNRIATEVFELMQTEFHEVEEPVPPGTVGSSTMPQKRNPNHVEDVQLLEAQLRGLAGPALQSMLSTHEAQSSYPRIASYTVIEATGLAGDILADLNFTFAGGFVLHNDSMWYNVKELNRGLIMSERVMLALGETMGRQAAHEVVYVAAQHVAKTPGTFLNDTLWEDARVQKALGDRKQLESLMDPSGYTGECATFAMAQGSRSISTAKQLFQAAELLNNCASLWERIRADPEAVSPSTTSLQKKCASIFSKGDGRSSSSGVPVFL